MRLSPLILLTAIGCGSSKNDAPWALDDAAKLRSAEAAAQLPSVLITLTVLLAAFADPSDDTACPGVLSQDDSSVTLGGDCTSGDGSTFSGQFTMAGDTDLALTFEDWGYSDDESDLHIDGEIDLVGEGASAGLITTSGLSVTMGGLSSDDYGASSLDLGFDGYQVQLPVDHDGDPDLFQSAGDTSFDGDISDATLGTVSVSGSYTTDTDTCTDEPVSGELSFEAGDATATVGYDGATGCDGCRTYTLSDGSTAQVCD